MQESRIRVLALYARNDALSYYDDWLDALKAHPGFDVAAFDIARSQRELRDHLKGIDAIVALHSTNGDSVAHLERHAEILAERDVPLLSFVGNELNLPMSPIASKRRVLGQIRPEWIATQLLPEAGEFLFGDLAARGIVPIPHALNVAVFKAPSDRKPRPIDIGTRVARYLPHLGDNDRNRIADRFQELGNAGRIAVDISHGRFNRDGWAGFLSRCKGTVSTEAGSWFLERDDATVGAIRDYLKKRAEGFQLATDSRLFVFGAKLPTWLKRLGEAALNILGGRLEHKTAYTPGVYEEVYEAFFAKMPRPAIYGKCISSRHFDAAGTKTCQILLRGRYNDILEADRHYLALDPDFGNLDDVLRRFADEGERDAITEAAYEHVLSAHTYGHRMRGIDALLHS